MIKVIKFHDGYADKIQNDRKTEPQGNVKLGARKAECILFGGFTNNCVSNQGKCIANISLPTLDVSFEFLIS